MGEVTQAVIGHCEKCGKEVGSGLAAGTKYLGCYLCSSSPNYAAMFPPKDKDIYNKALELMAKDFIENMCEEVSTGWADWDSEVGNWVMRPRPTEQDIKKFCQQYIGEAANKLTFGTI